MKILRPAVAAALIAALISTSASGEKVFRAIVHADLKNTDPIWTTATITLNHGYLIYDTLFAVDDKFEVKPQMAESYDISDDGLVYTITLRDGLKWHDGAPVTSADCIASIARWGKRDTMGQQLMSHVRSMEVVDDRTFQIKLEEPWSMVLDALAKPNSNVPFMMPERFAKTDAHEQVPEQIGSGPFKFVKEEWVPGAKVVYVKNEDYVPRSEPANAGSGGKFVYYDRLEWLYVPDHNSAANALINGEVDYIESPNSDLIPMLQQHPDVQVDVTDPFGWQPWLVINHKHPPFDNAKARQALQYMADQEAYLSVTSPTPDAYKVCGAIFICGTPFASSTGSERLMTQDFERAKALLKEAGYAGEKVVLMHPTDVPVLNPPSQVTAQLLRKIDINVEVQAMDWSTLTSRRPKKDPPEAGGWHLFHTAWPANTLLNPVIHAGVSGACDDAWFGWPCDEELQRLRAEFTKAASPEARKAVTEKIQARAMEFVPYVPLGQQLFYRAYRKNVKGVIPSVVTFFWNIEKE